MLVLTRAVRSLRRRSVGDESGFTLIEVVMASGVLMVVMSGLAYLGTVAFTDIATARVRQTATALANESIEQVRAMPYDRVSLGLKTSDLGGDPAITNDGTGYRFGAERIPHGDVPDVAPIVPHLSTSTTDDVPYTIGVYITYYDDDEYSGAYRVTAVVSWAASLRQSTVNRVEVETVIFAPSCGSDPTHVFAAPCEPYFHSATAAMPGGITIGDAGRGFAPLVGSTFHQLGLSLPQADTTLEGEQVTRMNTNVTTSGVTVRHSDSDTDAVAGKRAASAASSTDPSPNPPPPAHHSVATGSQASSTATVTGSGAALRYISSAGDSGVATATVLANAGNPCSDESNPAAPQLNDRPCGNGSTQQGESMSAVLTVGGDDATLATIGQPPSASAAHVARLTAATATRCPTAATWGCGRAAHRQAIGPVRVAAFPGGFTPPVGFDYLLKLDDVVTTVSAEAGDGNANPSATRVGTLRYWAGPVIGYASLDLGSPSSVIVPVEPVEVLDLLSNTKVTMSATVRTGALDAQPCAAPCAEAVASAESAVLAEILYTVEVGGVTVADLLIRVDLGTLTARAAFKVTG